jgi:hypothetical protein
VLLCGSPYSLSPGKGCLHAWQWWRSCYGSCNVFCWTCP